MRSVLRVLLPGGAVLALGIGLVATQGDDFFVTLTVRYGIVLFGAGAILAGAFHRSRVVAVLVALGCIEYVWEAPAPGTADAFPVAVTLALGLLGLLALMRDRGITSRGGLIQLGCAGLVGVGAYLAFEDPTRIAAFWEVQFLQGPLADAVRVPQATLAVSVVALTFTLYGAHRWGGPVERALVWGEMIVLASMWGTLGPAESSFLLMCAAVVLTISVLETSYFMAYRDELTGLPARRALMHDLDEIGGKYTIAMVDVDHFKKFNDKHGHDVGDQVLQLVAKHLASGPGGGKAYRYGGEEFTLVYPGRVGDEALPHADAVRAAVEDAKFSLRAWNRPRKKPGDGKAKKKKAKKKRGPRKLSVTISAGLADSTGKSGAPADVLKKADEALYRAKRAGRNRVAT